MRVKKAVLFVKDLFEVEFEVDPEEAEEEEEEEAKEERGDY